MPLLPPCPGLPAARTDLDWRRLHAFRERERRGAFYVACLEYGQFLWERRLPARAILCLDRAFGADLESGDPALAAWPLPYGPVAWILQHTPQGVFVGNPRVHFQHYADRLNGPRRDRRRWRAWACWALARAVQPHWPADPKHAVQEPSLDEIAQGLGEHGLPGEVEVWRAALAQAGKAGLPPAL